MGGVSTRRFFAFGLAAAGAIPLASRLLPFSSTNAVETAVRAVPIAPVVPKTFEAFGDVRIDNYDWLRDRKDPRVLSYLDAENAYADARLEPIKPLVDELAAELKTRGAQEEIVLDVGALAAGHPQQYQLGCWTVSPDNSRVAFAVDFTGDREYRIFVRSIASGETVDQGI